MTHYETNPAGRLYLFFEQLFAMDQNSSCADAVARVLGRTWPTDWPRIMEMGAALGDAHIEVKARLAALDSPVAVVAMKHIDQAGAPLSHFPMLGSGNQLQWFLSGLSPVGLSALDTASALLSQIRPDPVIAESDVESLLVRVTELLDQVATAEGLDDHARDWITSRLRRIEDALRAIKFTGYAGVERALNETVGGLRRHRSMRERLRRSPVIRDIVYLLVALDLALNVAANVNAIDATGSPEPSTVITEIERVTNVTIQDVEIGGRTYTFNELPALPTARPADEPTPQSTETAQETGR